VHTGQHYDRALSQVFFDELAIPEPKHRLDLHTADPDVIAPAIAAVVRSESPDLVLVYGDTHSTLAGARASVSVGVPVGHVELLIDLRCVSFDNERAAFAALSSMGGAGLEPAATCV
jgi:UDP-N-acetylglucosamine 2-epimerase